MKKEKKEVYKEILRNILNRPKCVNQLTRGIMSEKGGRILIKRFEKYGYVKSISFRGNINLIDLTEKGKELLDNLCSFKYEFKEKELFGGRK